MKVMNKKGLIYISIAVICAFILIFVGGKSSSQKGDDSERSISEYEQRTEQRLSSIIAELKGVSEVKVMVTASSDYERVYAKNTQANEEKVEYYNSADRTPLLLTELSPKISGVAVVCRGGDDMILQQKIKELVSEALSIGKSNIFVGS